MKFDVERCKGYLRSTGVIKNSSDNWRTKKQMKTWRGSHCVCLIKTLQSMCITHQDSLMPNKARMWPGVTRHGIKFSCWPLEVNRHIIRSVLTGEAWWCIYLSFSVTRQNAIRENVLAKMVIFLFDSIEPLPLAQIWLEMSLGLLKACPMLSPDLICVGIPNSFRNMTDFGGKYHSFFSKFRRFRPLVTWFLT